MDDGCNYIPHFPLWLSQWYSNKPDKILPAAPLTLKMRSESLNLIKSWDRPKKILVGGIQPQAKEIRIYHIYSENFIL